MNESSRADLVSKLRDGRAGCAERVWAVRELRFHNVPRAGSIGSVLFALASHTHTKPWTPKNGPYRGHEMPASACIPSIETLAGEAKIEPRAVRLTLRRIRDVASGLLRLDGLPGKPHVFILDDAVLADLVLAARAQREEADEEPSPINTPPLHGAPSVTEASPSASPTPPAERRAPLPISAAKVNKEAKQESERAHPRVGSSAGGRQIAGTLRPIDPAWKLDGALEGIAAESAVTDVVAVFAKFKSYHLGEGTLKVDWLEVWRGWCGREKEIQKRDRMRCRNHDPQPVPIDGPEPDWLRAEGAT